MLRKIHLAKCLYADDWQSIRRDLNKRAVEGVSGEADEDEIRLLLAKYGITSKEVTLWGTGAPMREFLWSEEMADACVYIMQNIDFEDLKGSRKEIRNCHVNIGTGRETSIRDLAHLIARTAGYSGKILFDPSKPDGTMRKLTDISKLHSLGWRHTIEIDEGVGKIYEWYCRDQF
jgi:GDP-L-fucose synthase